MFVINEDKSIYLTRGDIANIVVSATQPNGEPYTFQVGEVVRFKVFKRRDCTDVVLTKDVKVTEEGTTVTIYLDREDTKIGDIINRPINYWYEVEVNPDTEPQTIIGYDNNGEKILRLFPEGGTEV